MDRRHRESQTKCKRALAKATIYSNRSQFDRSNQDGTAVSDHPLVTVRNGVAILSSKIELPLSDTRTVEEAVATLRKAKSTGAALLLFSAMRKYQRSEVRRESFKAGAA
jgi:hypothetical protein